MDMSWRKQGRQTRREQRLQSFNGTSQWLHEAQRVRSLLGPDPDDTASAGAVAAIFISSELRDAVTSLKPCQKVLSTEVAKKVASQFAI
jgi:hypothetical protein